LSFFSYHLVQFPLVQIDGGVVEVVARVLQDELAVLLAKSPAHFAGHTGDQRVGRDDGVLRDDRASGDDGALADTRIVEDRRAHADQNGILKDAAVDGGVVADGDPVADDDGVDVPHAMEDGAVLDVGVGPDADKVDVSADDGVHPNAGVFTEDNIADDLGGDIDVAGGGDDGKLSLIGPDHAGYFRAVYPAA